MEIRDTVKTIVIKQNNEAFQKLRSSQVFQQAVLLGLLNQYFEIKLQIPTKRSVVTRQFFKIDEIHTAVDVIKVEEFVEQRCKEKYDCDISMGISEKTAKRRYETNRVTEQIHFMIDILETFGYVFHSKFTSGKKGAPIVETAVEIVYPNKHDMITEQMIPIIGSKINDYFAEQIFKKRISVFEKNNTAVLETIHLSEEY